MTANQWHPANDPPDSDRVVILRFGESGQYDCEGRYHAAYGAYTRRFTSAIHGRFVHPTSWREVFTGEEY